jgi:CRISPR-associated endonuclease/helicase Cas3
MTKALYHRYWGKAGSDDGRRNNYHLLPYHCLDVAALGRQLLKPYMPLCKQLAKQLKVEPEWLRTLFVFCLALHDLGKFARAFQGLRQELSVDLVKANSRMSYSERHDSLGFCLWQETLQTKLLEQLPSNESAGNEWLFHLEPRLEIVTGHHGMPPKTKLRTRNFFELEDEQAAMAFVQDTIALFLGDFDFQPLLDKALKKRLKPVSWQLAGVAVLADWLGSNQDHFKYCDKPKDLNVYWREIAIKKAEDAVNTLPKAPDVASFQTIENLFPFIQQPTPLQKYAINEALTELPQLFILRNYAAAAQNL